MIDTLNILLSGILLSICCYTDLKKRIIHNEVLVVFLIIDLIIDGFRVYQSGVCIFLDKFIGLLFPIVAGLLFFLTNTLGAGDIKLLCVLGFINGWRISFFTCMYSVLSGGIIALFVLALRLIKSKGRIDHQIPFAPAIAIGYTVALALT